MKFFIDTLSLLKERKKEKKKNFMCPKLRPAQSERDDCVCRTQSQREKNKITEEVKRSNISSRSHDATPGSSKQEPLSDIIAFVTIVTGNIRDLKKTQLALVF